MITNQVLRRLGHVLNISLPFIIWNNALGQGYPSKPIHFVVPMAAGGGIDLVARMASLKLRETIGQPIVIDNKPGAGGTIGAHFVANAAPDGYTILFISSSQVVAVSVYDKLPYDFVKDFAPVTQLTSSPQVLVVNLALPVKSVKELIALAKSHSGELNYASAGKGSSTHVAMELFKGMAGINMTHIPYQGQAQSVVDLLNGRVNLTFAGMAQMVPYIRDARVRAIATTGSRRSSILPDLPTVSEAGVIGFETTGWHGVLVPANTPRKIIDQLRSELIKIIHHPDVQKSFSNDGADVLGSSPEEFGVFLRLEVGKWGKVMKQFGIRAD